MQIYGHSWVMRDAACFVGVVEDEAGVDCARAGRAWKTADGGETHGSVEGAPALNGTCRSTRAEVEDDEIEG